jgi:hypothetical protein
MKKPDTIYILDPHDIVSLTRNYLVYENDLIVDDVIIIDEQDDLRGYIYLSTAPLTSFLNKNTRSIIFSKTLEELRSIVKKYKLKPGDDISAKWKPMRMIILEKAVPYSKGELYKTNRSDNTILLFNGQPIISETELVDADSDEFDIIIEHNGEVSEIDISKKIIYRDSIKISNRTDSKVNNTPNKSDNRKTQDSDNGGWVVYIGFCFLVMFFYGLAKSGINAGTIAYLVISISSFAFFYFAGKWKDKNKK